MIHVRNSVLNEQGTVDAYRLQPVSRLGGIAYGRLGDTFDLPRLDWEKEKAAVESVKKTCEVVIDRMNN